MFSFPNTKGQNVSRNSPAGQHPDRNNRCNVVSPGVQYDPYQIHGDIMSPLIGDQQQARSISTSSPSHYPSGIRASLSTSSSPLHHSEYPLDDKGLSYQQQYCYSAPIRNQDSHPLSAQYYNQQQPRPQLRHHPHQRNAKREGGVYYNVQQQPGRQSGISPHYSQGRNLIL